MTNPLPLLIIMGTIVVLVAIQRALTRFDASATAPTDESKTPPPKPKSRGQQLMQGLSVTGLDDRGLDRMRSLINKDDQATLATFLASHRPGVIEVDEFLDKARPQFLELLHKEGNETDADTIQNALVTYTPPTPPAGLQFGKLNAQEQIGILSFDPKTQHLVTRDFMSRFGSQSFDKCFDYYYSHNKSIAFQVLPGNPDREILEILIQGDAADKGRQISLGLRLTALKMDQLRQMCKDLNKDIKFASKQELTEALAQIPGSAVLLSMQCKVDDLFVLNPLNVNQDDVKKEWDYLRGYAKLLSSRNS